MLAEITVPHPTAGAPSLSTPDARCARKQALESRLAGTSADGEENDAIGEKCTA